MNLSISQVEFIIDGGVFAAFKMLDVELPPEGRKITINGITGVVSDVHHDLSNNVARVYLIN